MKKTILGLLLLCGTTLNMQAQTAEAPTQSGVCFEKISYAEAQKKAVAEKKMIFVDVSITGCAPCKYMADNVFPQKELGDYYNENFVSLHVNAMIKGDGTLIAETFGVRAFPTFLFIDPATGKLVHTSKGGKDAGQMMQLAKIAQTPQMGSVYMNDQWAAGNRNFDFLVDFYLMSVYEHERSRANAVIDELVTLRGGDFKDQEMVDFFFSYVNSKDNQLGKYFLDNTQQMIDRFGKEKVFEKIGKLR